MSTTATGELAPDSRLPSRRSSTGAIVARFAGWDYLRNVRMVESSFFIVVLPTALYLMFGGLSGFGDQQAGHGNVASYLMISMAVYGAVMATTSIAGSAAVERQKGWGRQLGLTGLTNAGYVTGKVLVALGFAVLPILVIYVVAYFTGARMDTPGHWLASAGLTLLGSLPFAFYGLAAALLFRSEAAVSAATGILVVFSFFGNLFTPLSGVLLDIAHWTPLYGVASLARWPQLEGMVIGAEGPLPASDPLWMILLNVGAWTLIFALLCLVASRRTRSR